MNGEMDKEIPPGIQCCVHLEPPQQLVISAPQQHYTPKFLNFGAVISFSTFCLLRRGKFCNINIMKRQKKVIFLNGPAWGKKKQNGGSKTQICSYASDGVWGGPLHTKGLEIWQMKTFKLLLLMLSFC